MLRTSVYESVGIWLPWSQAEVPKLFMSGMFCMSCPCCDVAEIYEEAFRPITMGHCDLSQRKKSFPSHGPLLNYLSKEKGKIARTRTRRHTRLLKISDD